MENDANPEIIMASNSCMKFLVELQHLELLGGSDELKRKTIADYKYWHERLLETKPGIPQ